MHGPRANEPLVSYNGSGLATRRFFHVDERGSILAESDDAGNVTTINRYDEYGQGSSTNSSRFQFAGMALETTSGLLYARARFYNPRTGRFMQPDPIGYGDGMNLYAYVKADPVNKVDPTGMKEDPLSNHAIMPECCVVTAIIPPRHYVHVGVVNMAGSVPNFGGNEGSEAGLSVPICGYGDNPCEDPKYLDRWVVERLRRGLIDRYNQTKDKVIKCIQGVGNISPSEAVSDAVDDTAIGAARGALGFGAGAARGAATGFAKGLFTSVLSQSCN